MYIYACFLYKTFNRRYTYDPFYCSPNENFEEELPITAGDYILVWGSKDEVCQNFPSICILNVLIIRFKYSQVLI